MSRVKKPRVKVFYTTSSGQLTKRLCDMTAREKAHLRETAILNSLAALKVKELP